MATVVLVIHLMIAAALVGIVLLQKSEGGALGIGGGGGGGFLTGRGTANVLTRTTAVLAAVFFVTSLILTILAPGRKDGPSIFDTPSATTGAPAGTKNPDGTPAPAGRGGVLDKLEGGQSRAPLPAVPQSK
ncbi:MAG: preprotein translocase subunit SecG [Hyphomicrobiaceae bacterium]|jgi:preprotein translocase subunit SecG